MNKKGVVNKSDYNRVVLTETIPFEVPLIFSNDGFYNQLNQRLKDKIYLDDFFKTIIEKQKPTKPLNYKIRKDSNSLRTLSLLHPSAQVRFVGFYKEYDTIICYHCSQSLATIRAPQNIGCSYYISNKNENLKKYKLDSVDTEHEEKLLKHPSSYFSYKGYNRIHKFYDSNAYLNLEKKFTDMWLLDISKCFDSIYTHTMSWAVKSKHFSKETKTNKSTFGQKFDLLMEGCNDQETNGILIGPEISRIFAEIILQDVDKKVISNLSSKFKYIYNKDYSFKRYVDDTFIFAKNTLICNDIANEIADQLSLYNLYINEKKVEKFERPFYTQNSIIINQLNQELSKFYKRITVKNNNGKIIPTTIYSSIKLKNHFINNVKLICATSNSRYSLVSSYIIAALTNKLVELVSIDQHGIDDIEDSGEKYQNCFQTILEIIFFFYSVEPTVTSSYTLSKSIILSNRFFSNFFTETSETIKQSIIELSINFLQQTQITEYNQREGLVPLEKLNVVISVSELGEGYSFSADFIENIFHFEKGNHSFFSVMTALFYIKDNPKYEKIKKDINKYIITKLTLLNDLHIDSEKAYTFLDIISCPYIAKDIKEKLLKLFQQQNGTKVLTQTETDNLISYMETNEWFVKWENIDLLNILEKKELQAVY